MFLYHPHPLSSLSFIITSFYHPPFFHLQPLSSLSFIIFILYHLHPLSSLFFITLVLCHPQLLSSLSFIILIFSVISLILFFIVLIILMILLLLLIIIIIIINIKQYVLDRRAAAGIEPGTFSPKSSGPRSIIPRIQKKRTLPKSRRFFDFLLPHALETKLEVFKPLALVARA